MTPFPSKAAFALILPLTVLAGCGGGGGASVTPDIGAANQQPAENTTEQTQNTGDSQSTDGGENTTDTNQSSGGSSGGSNTDTNTDTNGENNAETPDETQASTGETISGRVADGYLQGAIVCVDINENGACDDDEPSAVSGEGGVYSLDIPEDATDKPIIADVPATAIDEDTGEPIGKKLTLSTPADRPEFISPITTLVHEELRDNPNLTVEEAEGSVKEVLGLSDDGGAGLFEDYVANQQGDDTDNAEDYRFLHQTARVIATMMDDIQEQVESAANDSGLDFTSDEATRDAMRQLVRKEVRELLPDISLAVAQEIQARVTEDADTQTSDQPVLIDTEKLVNKLERDESQLDIVEKIDAIREKAAPAPVAMKDILQSGMYWLEVECEYEDIYESEELDADTVAPVTIMLDDDGAPTPIGLPRDCFAEYGHIVVEGEDNLLVEDTFQYDVDSGTWEPVEFEDDEQPFGFHLIDGQWVAATHDGPSGPVEFLDDGSAIVDSGFGAMLVYANSHSVANTPVVHHIFRRGGDAGFLRLVGEDDLFPEDAAVHHLIVKRKTPGHVLFNWAPHDEQSECEQFNGNCNVVDIMDDAGFAPATSLDVIREMSLFGVNLSGALHNHFERRPIDLELMADSNSAGLPESGTATWFMPMDNTGGIEYYPEEITTNCIPDEQFDERFSDGTLPCSDVEPKFYPECQPGEVPEGEAFADDFAVDVTVEAPHNEGPYNEAPHCENDDSKPEYIDEHTQPSDDNFHVDFTLQDDIEADGTVKTDEGLPVDGEYRRILGTVDWKLIEVDGVAMIEIELPLSVRHGTEAEGLAKYLLIEESGYVRRGAKMRDIENDDAIMYSEAAFATLQEVAEDYVSQ